MDSLSDQTPDVGSEHGGQESQDDDDDDQLQETDSFEPDVCECCDTTCTRSEPYRPQSAEVKKNRQGRSFQTSWCRDHRWITYCIERQKLYCFDCRVAATKQLISSGNTGSKGYAAFILNGFDNWKKAKQRFKEHELSQLHIESTMKIKLLQQPSVASQLSRQLTADQAKRREMLLKLLSSIKYLVRQGLPLRGHVKEEGNLIQLLKCRSEDVQGMDSWLESNKYLSHEIINEMIKIMALGVLRNIALLNTMQ